MPELSDAEHELILANPEADRFIAREAVKRAIARGMDPALAKRLYAYREPEPEPEAETLNRIAKEITLGLEPEKEDSPREAKARKEMTEEIEKAKEAGMIIWPVE